MIDYGAPGHRWTRCDSAELYSCGCYCRKSLKIVNRIRIQRTGRYLARGRVGSGDPDHNRTGLRVGVLGSFFSGVL